MIPIDLWTAEGRAELTAHFETMDRIQALDAEMRRLEDTLPDWLRRPAAETLAPLEGPEAERAARAASVAKWTQAAIDEWTDPPAAPEIKPAAEAPAEDPDFADLPIAPAPKIEQPEAQPSPGEIEAWLGEQMAQPAPEPEAWGAAPPPEAPPAYLLIPEPLRERIASMHFTGAHAAAIAVRLDLSVEQVRAVTANLPEPADNAADLDPERLWTARMKAEVWEMLEDGFGVEDVAVKFSITASRIRNLVYRIKAGKHPVPVMPDDEPEAEAPASTAIATTSTAGALVVPERGIARDPEMVQQWRDDMTEAERRKFVARSEYPEMHP